MGTDENLPGVVVLAVDQDEFTLDELARGLDADPRVIRTVRARDVTEALTHLQSEQIDIVFTETRLVGLSGMELARVLDAMAAPPSIVFVTSLDDETLAAFEVGALDYVLKPANPARLSRCIDRFQAERGLRYADRIPLEDGPGQVFLCHAGEDTAPVRRLYDRLVRDGVPCWWEPTDLQPDQERQQAIASAVRHSRYVLACITRRSLTDRGYLQEGIREAVQVADDQPEGATFLVPVRLQPCPIPQRLARWQWVDLFADGGYDRLLAALRVRPRV